MNNCINVNDRLPNFNEAVLAYFDKGDGTGYWDRAFYSRIVIDEEGKRILFYTQDSSQSTNIVTHWQPMPEAPKKSV